MIRTTRTAPPHSLVLVTDPSSRDVPKSFDGALVASTPACIAIGCQSELDGETEVVLGEFGEIEARDDPAFQGALDTPSRRVVVQTVLGEVLLDAPVASDQTRIRVWVNHSFEPDKIVIGLG